jgi:carboxyl-terminal processing protease
MPKRNLIWTVLIVAAGVAAVLMLRQPTRPDDPDQVRLLPVLRAFRMIRQNAYPRLPEDGAIQRGAVRGMAESVDEFTSYVPPGRTGNFNARLDGKVCCVGLRVDAEGGSSEIIGSMPSSPADEADIAPGGHLVSIDGRPADTYAPEEIQAILEGGGAGPVKLELVDRKGRPRACTLGRKWFAVETVTGLARAPQGRWNYQADPAGAIGYLRVKEFVPRTVERIRQALGETAGDKGIVLDLRDNPGGQLEAGFAVANLFLRKGVIFTRVDRGGRRQSFSAGTQGKPPHVPMVVLVNERTASAAELVAGALKLHDRAAVVGERTRGKGLVQSMIALPDSMGQVNLTTGEFFVGSRQRIAHLPGATTWGVEPHRPVDATAAEDAARRRAWAELDVAPRRQDEPDTAPATAPATQPTTTPATAQARQDPQLAEALRLLTTPGELDAVLAEEAQRRSELDKNRKDADALAPEGTTQPGTTQPASTQPATRPVP